MRILRRLTFIVAGLLVFPLGADPLLDAEEAFLQEINAMAGIELVGGPYKSTERSNFGVSGFFVIQPAVPIATLEQRLSVQTRLSDRTEGPAPEVPIANAPYPARPELEAADRRALHQVLAEYGYGTKRDEITLLDDGSVQARPVYHLPLIKLTGIDSNRWVALAGAQTWQGIPLYRATFDRARGTFELEIVRENFVPKRPMELPQRPFPVFAPQTFFADPGLRPEDWRKVLRNFAQVDLPAVQILDALVNETHATVRADIQWPVLPTSWIKFRKEASQWKIEEAVELRSEFPRPAPWWTFLPLLPATDFNDRYANSAVPRHTRLALGAIVQRLRGVGQITDFRMADKGSIRVTTTHNGWRGYHLDFAEMEKKWRLIAMTEWTD